MGIRWKTIIVINDRKKNQQDREWPAPMRVTTPTEGGESYPSLSESNVGCVVTGDDAP